MKIMNNTEKLAKLAVNKSLLKEYSNSSNERIVYMSDDTEFQIQIFNPYSYVIGVSLKFNDNSECNKLLVLKPGERVWLDRYLDNESKFLFSTYEVGTSKAVQKAIKNNGNLCIKFYKEKEQTIQISSITTYPSYKPYNEPKTIDVWYGNEVKLGNSVTCYCQTLDANISNGIYADEASYTSSAATCASINTSCSSINNATNMSGSRSKSKSMETGRIEKGSHSNQKFENVYKDFEYFPFKTEYIKILPTSQKQVNSNDLQKKYCHECGKKLNPKFKFCPSCGAKQ